MKPDLPPLLVVTGPTATGKTRLGVELALRLGGEVVNADSRYLYRGLDIGTAKPTPDEMRGVPHHLIDIREPSGEMSLATYQRLAFAAIDDVTARGRLPVLVGGTPLYVNAVVENWRIPEAPPHPEIRARLEAEIAEHGLERVTARLAQLDPVAAERSGGNARRVVRALEIHEVTGRPMSELEGKGPVRFDTVQLVLELDHATLYERIDRRVDEQIAAGLLDEVRGLLDRGIDPTAPAMSSIGYRQLIPVVEGAVPLDVGIEAIRRDTRRYVRHQLTWLRGRRNVVRIDVSRGDPLEQALTAVYTSLWIAAPACARAVVPAPLTAAARQESSTMVTTATEAARAGFAHPDVLVDTQWVEHHLGDEHVRVVESDEDILLYDIGHIPGAVKLDWHTDLQDEVRRDFVDKAGFEALMSRAGIANDTTVVFYGDRNNWYACYTFWLFRYFGHDESRLKIMDGGRSKWEAEGRPWSRDYPSYPATSYTAQEPDTSIRAFRDDVMASLEKVRAGQASLIDVRSPQEYTGEVIHMMGYPQEGAQRGGHIAGAKSVPWGKAANEDGTFKSAEELRALYGAEGVSPDKPTIAYCRIGERSSHTWFVLTYLLGHPDVRNYDGSWTEWGSLVNVPIEKG